MDVRPGLADDSLPAVSRDRLMTMNASLIGSLPLKDIHAHYADLFTKGGWRQVEEQLGSTIAVATFEITSGGQSWLCTMITSIPAGDGADV